MNATQEVTITLVLDVDLLRAQCDYVANEADNHRDARGDIYCGLHFLLGALLDACEKEKENSEMTTHHKGISAWQYGLLGGSRNPDLYRVLVGTRYNHYRIIR